MINMYLSNGSSLQKQEITEITQASEAILAQAVWIDLFNPTLEEEHWLEARLSIGIPNREEMQEIEITSRLYKEKNVLYMTATMLAQSDTDKPVNDAVSFVLSEKRLITVRYIEPHPFKQFLVRVCSLEKEEQTPLHLLIYLLDATVDRIADILERVGHNLDGLAQIIFHANLPGQEKIDYQKILRDIGANGDITARSSESIVSFSRLLIFLSQADICKHNQDAQQHIVNFTKDLSSLSDHAGFLSSKVTFLLDATLGMISIEQSDIIKIFSVAAVMFLPPTLIASIYGMNFHFMPELAFKWAYPLVLFLMFLSAWLPYRYFKHRDWL